MPAPAFAELCARSNFSLLDGASHPAEIVSTAATHGYAGIGICDANTLAGVVQGHVAAKELGLPFAVGARLLLEDGAEFLAWPTDRASYGRLTALLSRGKMLAPKGECHITHEGLCAFSEGLALAVVADGGADFAARLREDAAALRDRLPLPLHVAVACSAMGDDEARLDRIASMARAGGAVMLATTGVLGLGMLSCLRRGFDLLRNHRHVALDLASVPRDDPATYEMLRRADSLGVFQVESRAQMAMLPRLRPKEFYDLVVQVAIVRPGPIQGDMVHPYIRRRWGLEEPEYPGPSPEHGPPDELKIVLGRTLGVPLFQEQAMRLAIVAAQFSPDEADALRRAMATFKYTQGVGVYRDRLVGGMVRRGYAPDMAERVFKQIEGFGSYGFPESHAASFAHLVYASSWLKCHHPAVFACALLNSQPMGFYAPAQIVRDAKEHGVVVRPICVNSSDWDCTLEADARSADQHAMRLGLRLVSGMREEDGRALVKARAASNGAPFTTIDEVSRRAGVSRRGIEALAGADAFADLGLGRREARWESAAIDTHAMRDLPLFGAAAKAEHPDARPMIAEAPPSLPAMPEGEAIGNDYAATGLSLRRHPLALLRPILAGLRCDDTRALSRLPQGRRVRVAGLVLMRQQPMTAKGVIFMTIEDEHGHANVVVYTHIAERDRVPLLTSRLVVVDGRVEREDQHAEVPIVHLIASRLVDQSDLLGRLATMGEAAGPKAISDMRMPATRDFR